MAKKSKEYQWDGIMRLIQGIVLLIYDKVAISGKWKNKDISDKALGKKLLVLEEMRIWLKSRKWRIWLSIYCEHYGGNSRTITKNFEKIRRSSVRHVKRRIRERANLTEDQIMKPVKHQ